ncbi:MAG: hypothetical protein DRG39_06630 [Deltaproteobacteria bacterium]|nr:MAG: hypothetical protein DRG39_06630 [Deltaproteobacteria bacterium]
MKNYIEFVKRESGGRISATLVIMTITAGIANGLAVATAIIAAGTLKEGELHFRTFLLFCSLMALFCLSKRYSMNESIKIVEESMKRVRFRILKKLRTSNLLNLESIDKGIFFSALASDASTISQSTSMAINAVSSTVMLIFIIIYIAFMSLKALFITIAIITFMVLMYLSNEKKVAAAFEESVKCENRFMDNLRGLLDGFKELKLNRKKYIDFDKSELSPVIDASKQHRIDAGLRLNVTILLAQTFLLISIGGLLFILPQIDQSQIPLIPRLIALIIFSATPISDFAMAIPAVSKAEASINNIHTLEALIDIGQSRVEQLCEEQPIKELKWDKIVLDKVFFQFPERDNSRPFSIGPIDVEFHKGEIVFIIGGNGSGKSTFLKVLTSLYAPTSGRILLDDTEVTPYNKASYRNLFSAIFTDYYLFKRLLGIDYPDNELISYLLDKMELSHKTSIENGVITSLDLSTGQKKRLALIISILEDKPIMIFDEWAADQDPTFRKFFYDVLLQELKAKGKTIIAVTHDDRYFYAADKIYKMEYGKFIPFEL